MPLDDNPFTVTKAVDFTDKEIAEFWVDLDRGGFASIANPAGSMPRILVGGKGGGRTHLLRYFSYSLQRLRHHTGLVNGLRDDGYVGMYFRCGGLNASRFTGKGQDPEAWDAVFAYYMDVWLAQLTVDVLLDIDAQEPILLAAGDRMVADLRGLLGLVTSEAQSLVDVRDELRQRQLLMDQAINNVALTRSLDVRILSSPGDLVFGVPEIAQRHLPALAGIHFAYLLDELENLSERQQRYVNTLIREKRLPSNFVVGSRQYGLRTFVTLSAAEENKQGSEYDMIVLERAYRSESGAYSRFCRDVVRRRLVESGYPQFDDSELKAMFVREAPDPWLSRAALDLISRSTSSERPYFTRLRRQLLQFGADQTTIDGVLEVLARPNDPVLEKFAVLQFYRNWAANDELIHAAARAALVTQQLLDGERSAQGLWKLWRDDLFAQLQHDYQRRPTSVGLERYIEMSGYLPRNLLIILKQITKWALFNGELPFATRATVSSQAQIEGVREAADWYLKDSRSLGPEGQEAERGIRRLGGFFRELRFSDKPVEVSLCTFSTDREEISSAALRVMDHAVRYGLLVELQGTPHRNSGILQHKYQLHPMLSPLFDLPTARRGVIPMKASELEAIFDPNRGSADYQASLDARLESLNAPFRKSARFEGAQEFLL